MDEELRERRQKTWKMLCVQGLPYYRVVEKLSSEYDVTESAIKVDINRMDSWLPKLDEGDPYSAYSRLRELRENRQQTQQLVRRIRNDEDGEHRDEIQARQRIDKSIKLDIELSQSLGFTDKEPDKVEMTWRDIMEADEDDVEGDDDE